MNILMTMEIFMLMMEPSYSDRNYDVVDFHFHVILIRYNILIIAGNEDSLFLGMIMKIAMWWRQLHAVVFLSIIYVY